MLYGPGRAALSHLHVPDGVLPWWAVLLSLLVVGGTVAAVLAFRGGRDPVRFLPRVGVAGAALVVAMSIPLGPGIHLSLAPLAGMMLGPGGGFLAAFLANAVLASLGHGGITALGMNGAFLGLQAAVGAGLFAGLRRFLGVRAAGAVAAALTLALAAVVAIAAIRALPVGGDVPVDRHFVWAMGDDGACRHAEIDDADDWRTWLVALLAAGAVVVEATFTASTLAFLSRVRGDLVHGGAPRPRTSGEAA